MANYFGTPPAETRLGRVAVLLSIALLVACGDGGGSGPAATFQPGDRTLLSVGSPTGDEDPSILLARDGTIFVAWFSNRGGNPDIYMASTRNGRDWTAAQRVTTSVDGDFYPTLLQDEQGVFHMTWFRWNAPFRGHIWYNSSPDGVTWNTSNEVQVTTGADVDDWVPTPVRAADGTLLVYFVSDKRDAVNPTSELYLAAKAPSAQTWDPAAPVTALNSASLHDHLPVAARTGNSITLVWVRHDTRQALPWLNPKSDLFFSTSADGRTWASPTKITTDAGDIVHLFPALTTTLDARWSLLWLSTRLGSAKAFELSLTNLGQYPTGVVEQTSLPPGYSHHVAPTPTPGVYLGVWVEGPDGAQDIYYRLFRK